MKHLIFAFILFCVFTANAQEVIVITSTNPLTLASRPYANTIKLDSFSLAFKNLEIANKNFVSQITTLQGERVILNGEITTLKSEVGTLKSTLTTVSLQSADYQKQLTAFRDTAFREIFFGSEFRVTSSKTTDTIRLKIN